MKHLLTLLILLCPEAFASGDYYHLDIDTYDPETGLYYKSVVDRTAYRSQ